MARRIAARLIEIFSTFPISLQSAEWARHSAALIIEASMSSPPAETGCASKCPTVGEIQKCVDSEHGDKEVTKRKNRRRARSGPSKDRSGARSALQHHLHWHWVILEALALLGGVADAGPGEVIRQQRYAA